MQNLNLRQSLSGYWANPQWLKALLCSYWDCHGALPLAMTAALCYWDCHGALPLAMTAALCYWDCHGALLHRNNMVINEVSNYRFKVNIQIPSLRSIAVQCCGNPYLRMKHAAKDFKMGCTPTRESMYKAGNVQQLNHNDNTNI